MPREEIIGRLQKDIEFLREPEYGYIRAGYPRFMALFGRDSVITAWQLIEHEPLIAERTLAILAKLQGKETNLMREEEPGKILHEWHPKPEEYKILPWPLPYYGSVDSTPLFIFLSFLYYERTTDTKWLASFWPHIERALEWCERYGDLDGDRFLEYEKKNPFGLEHQGWKDSRLDHLELRPPIELVEVQGYYYLALIAANELALAFQNVELATHLRHIAQELKSKFLDAFWSPEKNFFSIALERSRKPDFRVASNPGHLLFTGILDDERQKADAVVVRLFAEDMWTPYGIRTHAESNLDYDPWSYHLGSIWPHDNWIIAQGLKRLGYREEYQKIKSSLIAAYEAFGEIPELYTYANGKIERIPIACAPQAWATGALLNFLSEDAPAKNLL